MLQRRVSLRQSVHPSKPRASEYVHVLSIADAGGGCKDPEENPPEGWLSCTVIEFSCSALSAEPYCALLVR